MPSGDEELARLRELLRRLGYTETKLCAATGAASIHSFPAIEDGRTAFSTVDDAQSVLVRLFFDADAIPWISVREVFRPDDLATLESIGLLHDCPGDAALCVSTIHIYPHGELYLASDRTRRFLSTLPAAPPDVVYPPIANTTRRMLELMPRNPCDDVLDLCSGTGVVALVAASEFAKRAWAVDITDRSTRFAQLNARLNGLSSVVAVQGDLYEPVSDRMFDLIVAHPPYMPALEPEYVFRDGGEDGEQVTRRILAGLASHLRKGGQCFCDCLVTERDDAPVENRVRAMLGPDHTEFDVVVAEHRRVNPGHYYADLAAKGQISFATAERVHQLYQRLGITALVLVAILVRRRAESRPVVTERRLLSNLTRSSHLQWLLSWLAARAGASADALVHDVLESRPLLAPTVELRSRSTLRRGVWTPDACQFVTLLPFAAQADCPCWYAKLLLWCDGSVKAADHLQHARDTGLAPADMPDAEFAEALQSLADYGFIELGGYPRPRGGAPE